MTQKSELPLEEQETQTQNQTTSSQQANPGDKFTQLTSVYEACLEKLSNEIGSISKKNLERLTVLAAEHPLKKTKNIVGQTEIELFNILARIAECKYNMYLVYTANEEPELLFQYLEEKNIEKFRKTFDDHINKLNSEEKEDVNEEE